MTEIDEVTIWTQDRKCSASGPALSPGRRVVGLRRVVVGCCRGCRGTRRGVSCQDVVGVVGVTSGVSGALLDGDHVRHTSSVVGHVGARRARRARRGTVMSMCAIELCVYSHQPKHKGNTNLFLHTQRKLVFQPFHPAPGCECERSNPKPLARLQDLFTGHVHPALGQAGQG